MSGVSDILGHERVVRLLWRGLEDEQVHHAYLFEGPTGVGKATVALRYAMAANCEQAGPRLPERLPCGTCRTCQSIEKGTHPDVISLAPDSTRASQTIPVDRVREVIRQTTYHRYAARRRLVIIEPAEAMPPPAANAILKTLEEPPEGTGFILISHNTSALLPTILSRCQRLRFGAVPQQAIADWLRARGKVDTADSAAAAAQGCPGRALVLANGGLQTAREQRDALLTALQSDVSGRFEFSGKIVRGSRQQWAGRMEGVLGALEELLRDATVIGSGSHQPLLNDDRRELVEAWARALWPSGIATCEKAITETRKSLAIYVTGKTALDALLGVFVRELGSARGAA